MQAKQQELLMHRSRQPMTLSLTFDGNDNTVRADVGVSSCALLKREEEALLESQMRLAELKDAESDGKQSSSGQSQSSMQPDQAIRQQYLAKNPNDAWAGSQYYQNGTLSGRAKQVYASIRARLANEENGTDGADSASATFKSKRKRHALDAFSGRVQHDDDEDELAERKNNDDKNDANDQGMTLSMHQPWASLLVLGIKRYEGRTWPTRYRGRLWIAAAAKVPDQETIAAVEQQFRDAYPDEQLPFPKSYPTSCVLGCVDLVDCIDQDAFQELRKKELAAGRAIENSESPFLFVCKRPQRLLLAQQMKGQHKLWKLPADCARNWAPLLTKP
eukprot:TRINITY_DN94144_c0_g1_i1.p1 TRINITY_DN94144_c0_g1~~TRINITY_DN94144_c0_g1_i1.p1  ORF type:complete len:371 (-),score=187.85 TRINITY_DN94144_c0_g1_i1:19-1014(-)